MTDFTRLWNSLFINFVCVANYNDSDNLQLTIVLLCTVLVLFPDHIYLTHRKNGNEMHVYHYTVLLSTVFIPLQMDFKDVLRQQLEHLSSVSSLSSSVVSPRWLVAINYSLMPKVVVTLLNIMISLSMFQNAT